MNKISLSDELIKILDALAEKMGMVVDWTSDNVLPYLEKLGGRFVSYELWTSVVWLLLGFIIVLIGMVTFKKIKGYYKQSDDLDEYNINTLMCVLCIVAFILCMLIGLPLVLTQIFDIIACYTFPEKVILEELRDIYTTMQTNQGYR